MDNHQTFSIAKKLQFYRMFQKSVFVAALLGCLLCLNNVNAQTPYVRYVKPNDTVPETAGWVKYYVETYNPTPDTFRCVSAVVLDSTTATPVLDLNAGNSPIMVPPGVTQIDSIDLQIVDDHLHDPFERIAYKFVNLSNPAFLSADSFQLVYILDDDPFNVSFIGAARSIVEHDTTFLLRLALNGEVAGETQVKISLDLSNATKGKDFDFKDTVVTLPAFSFDTIYIPVTIIDDTIIEANEQVNFVLSDPTNGAIIDIVAFTLTIIDNDLPPSAISDVVFEGLKVYPNPLQQYVNIDGLNESAEWTLVNAVGKVLQRETTTYYPAKIEVGNLPAGFYVLEGRSGSSAVRRTVIKQ